MESTVDPAIIDAAYHLGEIIGTILAPFFVVFLILALIVGVIAFVVIGGGLFLFYLICSVDTPSTPVTDEKDPILQKDVVNHDDLKPCVDTYRSLHPYSFNPFDKEHPWGYWS